MKRLSQWALVLAGLCHTPFARAADPAPAAESPAALPAAVSPIPGGLDGSSACRQPDCQACCEPDDGRFGLVGGAGIYWMQPYFTNNPAFTVTQVTSTGPSGTPRAVTSRANLGNHMEVAPMLWLGYVSDSGLGGRVRWWHFRHGTDQGVAVGPGAPGTLTFISSAAPMGFTAFADNNGQTAALAVTSKLELQVWDAEATTSVQSGKWDLLLAGGVRYAHIAQNYNAFVSGDSGGTAGPITATVLSGHSFDGIGPVVALEARRALCDCGLSLYGSARGAILFGSARQTAFDAFVSGDGSFIDDATERRNPVVPVGELELGLEYGRCIGSSRVFSQVALVGQQWWGIGSASRAVNTNSFGVPNPGGGSIVDSDLGLLGLAFRTGVSF
jgi:hypothetical protein